MNNYKVAHYALLQRGKRYYNVDWLIHYKAGQSLPTEGHALQKSPSGRCYKLTGAKTITKWGWLFITKWVNPYCKVGDRYY